MDDAFGAHPPQGWLVGIVLTWFASRVSALIEDCGIALDALGARRAEISLVGSGGRARQGRLASGQWARRHVHIFLWRRLRAQAFDEAVAKVIGQVESLAMRHGAIAVGEFRVAFRIDSAAIAVIDDAIRFERPALVINPRIAFGRNRVFINIIAKFAGLNEHLGRFTLCAALGRRQCCRFRRCRYRDCQQCCAKEWDCRRNRGPHDPLRAANRGNPIRGANTPPHYPSS